MTSAAGVFGAAGGVCAQAALAPTQTRIAEAKGENLMFDFIGLVDLAHVRILPVTSGAKVKKPLEVRGAFTISEVPAGLAVAAKAAAVHPEAAPDFVDRFFVRRKFVRISAHEHDVVVGYVGGYKDFALAGLAVITG